MKKAVCLVKGHIKVQVSKVTEDSYRRDHLGDRVACRRCRMVLPKGTSL